MDGHPAPRSSGAAGTATTTMGSADLPSPGAPSASAASVALQRPTTAQDPARSSAGKQGNPAAPAAFYPIDMTAAAPPPSSPAFYPVDPSHAPHPAIVAPAPSNDIVPSHLPSRSSLKPTVGGTMLLPRALLRANAAVAGGARAAGPAANDAPAAQTAAPAAKATAPDAEHEPNNNNNDNKDVILSLKDPTYKSILFDAFRTLPLQRATKENKEAWEREKEWEHAAARKAYARLQQQQGGGGRFLRPSLGRKAGEYVAVDERGALKKINEDIRRRLETKAHWLATPLEQGDVVASSSSVAGKRGGVAGIASGGGKEEDALPKKKKSKTQKEKPSLSKRKKSSVKSATAASAKSTNAASATKVPAVPPLMKSATATASTAAGGAPAPSLADVLARPIPRKGGRGGGGAVVVASAMATSAADLLSIPIPKKTKQKGRVAASSDSATVAASARMPKKRKSRWGYVNDGAAIPTVAEVAASVAGTPAGRFLAAKAPPASKTSKKSERKEMADVPSADVEDAIVAAHAPPKDAAVAAPAPAKLRKGKARVSKTGAKTTSDADADALVEASANESNGVNQEKARANGPTRWQCPVCAKAFEWARPGIVAACIGNHMKIHTPREVADEKRQRKLPATKKKRGAGRRSTAEATVTFGDESWSAEEPATKKKRGRGRPNNSGSKALRGSSAATVTFGDGPFHPGTVEPVKKKRGRGRPRKNKQGAASKATMPGREGTETPAGRAKKSSNNSRFTAITPTPRKGAATTQSTSSRPRRQAFVEACSALSERGAEEDACEVLSIAREDEVSTDNAGGILGQSGAGVSFDDENQKPKKRRGRPPKKGKNIVLAKDDAPADKPLAIAREEPEDASSSEEEFSSDDDDEPNWASQPTNSWAEVTPTIAGRFNPVGFAVSETVERPLQFTPIKFGESPKKRCKTLRRTGIATPWWTPEPAQPERQVSTMDPRDTPETFPCNGSWSQHILTTQHGGSNFIPAPLLIKSPTKKSQSDAGKVFSPIALRPTTYNSPMRSTAAVTFQGLPSSTPSKQPDGINESLQGGFLPSWHSRATIGTISIAGMSQIDVNNLIVGDLGDDPMMDFVVGANIAKEGTVASTPMKGGGEGRVPSPLSASPKKRRASPFAATPNMLEKYSTSFTNMNERRLLSSPLSASPAKRRYTSWEYMTPSCKGGQPWHI